VVRKGELAHAFQPDVIMALGGGSPMDAAKIIWVMYEHPEVHFADLALRFMDIRKRIYQFPSWAAKPCWWRCPPPAPARKSPRLPW
jgi:acetaldehyde dehydrogenase/alcohol dehydrogenase